MSEEERDQIVLTPDAESYQTPEWISRLASERRIVREQLDERKGVRVPSEDPDYGYEGEAWPVWAERERDAILPGAGAPGHRPAGDSRLAALHESHHRRRKGPVRRASAELAERVPKLVHRIDQGLRLGP